MTEEDSREALSLGEKGEGKPNRFGRIKTYKCKLCNDAFSNSSGLVSHLKVHSEELPICPTCDYTASTFGDLLVHMMKHSGEKEHLCSMCDYTCSTSSALRIHIRVHTGEKPYMCDKCSKEFKTRSSLSRHHLVHKNKP